MRCKKTIDARSFSHATLEDRRVSAVKRVEAGESPEVVADGLSINRRTIYRWLKAFHYGGKAALKAKPIRGAPPKLNAKQMQRLAKLIRTKTAQQYKFEFALWTLKLIRLLIRHEFGVRLSEVSVGRLMRRLGFSPQRPLYRAWQQDPDTVAEWHETVYPKIKARAKREGAMIFFADEAGRRSDYHSGTTWAPRNQTPVVKATGARYGLNIISAVNAGGHFRFMTTDGSVTAAVFRDFLQRLITGVDRKIFLIVDGHPTHKAKLVTRFVAAHVDRLELFVLPPYSPELNPDELAWAHVKTQVAKTAPQTKAELKATVTRALHQLQKLPTIVAGFFHTPSCTYAAF